MKKQLIIPVLMAGLLVWFSGCGGGSGSLRSSEDSLSYALGMSAAKQMQKDGMKPNPDAFTKGCKDYFNGAAPTSSMTGLDSLSYQAGNSIAKSISASGDKINADIFVNGFLDLNKGETILTETQAQAVLRPFFQKLNQAMMEKQQRLVKDNLDRSMKWLEENAKKPGVVTHPSGMQYKEIKAGTGRKPKLEDQVTIHYEGRLTNGEIFDSSFERGQPATFPLMNLIESWKIALPMMKEGAIWELYCPPNMAYGEMGSPPKIGPNEALIFKIEFFQIGAPAPGK